MTSLERRILYIQYNNPAAYPPLEHSSSLLAERGWKVRFLGCHVPGIESFRFDSALNVKVDLMPAPSRPGNKSHYAQFCWRALKTALLWQPNAIYVSELNATLPALVLSYLGFNVYYHEHDTPVLVKSPTFFQRVLFASRRALASRAESIVVPNEERAKTLAVTNMRKLHVIGNCPRKSQAAWQGNPTNDTTTVVYHGSIGPARLPKTVLQAIALLGPRFHLKVIGYTTAGHPHYAEELHDEAERLGIQDQFHWIGAVPNRKGVLKEIQSCQIGLALMPLDSQDPNERTMAGASNKPFDYLAYGLSLVVSDLPDWERWFGSVSVKCNPSDAHDIARAFRWLVSHPDERRRMADLGQRRILSEWNYEAQFQPLLKQLES